MNFREYQHIERFGTEEVEGIELGNCFIFPKIDGTNGSIWTHENQVLCGSRKRELSLDNDNAGFYEYVQTNQNLCDFLKLYPQYRLFGEWLVPHSLKTYKKDVWRKFYIFDVTIDSGDGMEYLSYYKYKILLDEFNLDYIPCIAVLKNGSYDQFINWLNHNNFLIEDGKGIGEGIVIKNYDYHNKYGRQTWAKIVTFEFKEKHAKEMGPSVVLGKKMIEEEIANKYCTSALVEKTFEKIKLEKGGWSSKYISELFKRVTYDLITEEIWNILKEYKYPIINYKTLNTFIINKIKEHKPDIF